MSDIHFGFANPPPNSHSSGLSGNFLERVVSLASNLLNLFHGHCFIDQRVNQSGHPESACQVLAPRSARPEKDIVEVVCNVCIPVFVHYHLKLLLLLIGMLSCLVLHVTPLWIAKPSLSWLRHQQVHDFLEFLVIGFLVQRGRGSTAGGLAM